jgi:hypothetical protein
MRSLNACLGTLLLCTAAGSAMADSGLTITRPPANSAAQAAYDGDDGGQLQYRRAYPPRELMFRRAQQAAQLRDARIQARRLADNPALRPNMAYGRPVVEWQYVPWVRYPAPYYPATRVR